MRKKFIIPFLELSFEEFKKRLDAPHCFPLTMILQRKGGGKGKKVIEKKEFVKKEALLKKVKSLKQKISEDGSLQIRLIAGNGVFNITNSGIVRTYFRRRDPHKHSWFKTSKSKEGIQGREVVVSFNELKKELNKKSVFPVKFILRELYKEKETIHNRGVFSKIKNSVRKILGVKNFTRHCDKTVQIFNNKKKLFKAIDEVLSTPYDTKYFVTINLKTAEEKGYVFKYPNQRGRIK